MLGCFAAEPLFADRRKRFYYGVRELSYGFIVAALLIVDPGNRITDDQALAGLVMRPQTLQKGFRLFSVFEPESLIAIVCEKLRYAGDVTFERELRCE